MLVSTLDQPWDGLDSLTQHALRTATRIEQSGIATVEVVAPLEARLEMCKLEAGTLRYVVGASSRAVADRCSVGLFGVQASGGIVSERLPMPPKSWKRAVDRPGYQCARSRRADGALRVSVMVSIGPFVVDRQTTSDAVELGENPRVVAYGQFDAGLKRLTEVVQNPSSAKNEDEFHSIVARLFTLAGFAVDSFVADASLTGKGIPDFLAYAPDGGSILVVECTTGHLASPRDKLSLLVGRARRVRAVLKNGSDEHVLPVIVTAQPAVAPHELDAARRSRVAVLTQKELQELLELAQNQEPLQAIMRWCQAHIVCNRHRRFALYLLAPDTPMWGVSVGDAPQTGQAQCYLGPPVADHRFSALIPTLVPKHGCVGEFGGTLSARPLHTYAGPLTCHL